MNSFKPHNDGLPPDENTRKQIEYAKKKWEACVEAIEFLKGRIYSDEEMRKMLHMNTNMDGQSYVYMVGRNLPILMFAQDREGLYIEKLYS